VQTAIKTFTPTSGPVGTPVTITGVSLAQASKVTFGGVKATMFTVNSDTQVTADVPHRREDGENRDHDSRRDDGKSGGVYGDAATG
jgi:hypothetical protein